MPRLLLYTRNAQPPIPVELPSGGQLLLPRLQFRCWVRLPGFMFPRDAVIDTGSPFSWFPEELWGRFQPGIDFEWLPFPAGYQPPPARTAGWAFRYRMAHFLTPITLFDNTTALTRDGVIAQFTTGTPPTPVGSNRPAVAVFGLWGGVLEGTRLAITPNPRTGGVDGVLEF